LEHPLHRGAYSAQAVEQEAKGDPGGFVQLRPVSGALAGERMVLILDDLVAQLRAYEQAGWAWKDLAVLVRNNRQGAAVVERLVAEDIPVISADSLMLGQSVQVRFWMAALAAAHRPQSALARAELAVEARKSGVWKPTSDLPTAHHLEVLAAQERPFWQAWSGLFPHWDLRQLRTEGLYGAAESVVRWSGIQPDAYGLAWLSLVLRFGQQEANSWPAFWSAWESDLQNQSIVLPDGLNATVVMTVHKSKGLTFDCVILPDVGGTKLAEVLDEVVGERVVVIDDQEHRADLSGGFIPARCGPMPLHATCLWPCSPFRCIRKSDHCRQRHRRPIAHRPCRS
jgi:hypothetical protein